MLVSVAGARGADAQYAARRAALAERATLEELPADGRGRVSLVALLERLGRREINELWVESGPQLAGALLAEEQVDELLLYVAPRLIGPQGRPLAELPALTELQDSPWFDMMDIHQVGADLRLRLRPKRR